MTKATQLLLVWINTLGIIAFVYLASREWPPPDQRGLPGAAGDAIVWTITVFPVIAIAFILNIAWLMLVFTHRKKGKMKLQMVVWLVAILSWYGALRYDTYRSYNGEDIKQGKTTSLH